ncbi:hypothetical protein [Mucilaginibacter flavus]|uniref:hypothetical protein n=1 Tax=Mucilaginibacter flavus TaxID=931504 RepID=UPI0025B4BBC9|nr:hypothetical protein [Mucilaginibacter flavus]MDN3579402.1 hypothetical protein [Mucilaginibacter flavus]
MIRIEEKLKTINEAWEIYFCNYRFCKSKINFETQSKINYYADIFNYLRDTLPFVQNIEYFKDFNYSVFQATGVMQTIYAQQDLIDEILYIFKEQPSSQEDKNPNRTIRNELIGHPIRRKPVGRELISSIFLGQFFSNGTINYILYSVDNDFKGKDTYHSLSEIIERHKDFLNKYLNILWEKIKVILVGFKKTLDELKKLVHSMIPFKNILDLVEHRFEAIFKSEKNFKKDALLYYFENSSTHPRYSHSIDLFIESLKESLCETIDTIEKFTKVENDKSPQRLVGNDELITFTVDIVDGDQADVVHDFKALLNYEFSKLFDRHPIYDIEYFKSEFRDIEIIEELQNMEINYSNDIEYYCSYEYLQKLLTSKNLL